MHYNRGKIECWDFIADHRLDYLRGNAVKYICRAGFKDAIEQDLRKAAEYLQKTLGNTTYPRVTEWEDYTPQIDPIEFGRDQKLSPPLSAALVLICQWDIAGALHFVLQELDNLTADAKPKEHQPPVVYGTDEKLFADNRNDRRVFEFGKRVGEKV